MIQFFLRRASSLTSHVQGWRLLLPHPPARVFGTRLHDGPRQQQRRSTSVAAAALASVVVAYNSSTAASCTTFPEDALYYDTYNGVIIDLDAIYDNDTLQSPPPDFDTALAESLQVWKDEGKRGIWIHVGATQSDKIHAAMQQGFDFHMVAGKKLILSQWLPQDQPSRLPLGPNHQVGVGCFLLHPKDPSKMLVVQEKTGPAAAMKLWKMPTGLSDPGEDIHEAAMRELLEETGITATFEGIVAFRQAHSSKGRNRLLFRASSDLFFVCKLKLSLPDDVDAALFQACPDEIAAIQWMAVADYCAQERWQSSPVYLDLNGELLRLSKALTLSSESIPTLWNAHNLELGFGRGFNTVYRGNSNL